MNMELRKYPRYTCHLKINITCEDGSSWEMSTLDVSVEGMRILSSDTNVIIEPSSLVTVRLQKQYDLEPLVFSGVVRHYSLEQNGQVVFGIQITPLSDEIKTKWHHVVEQIRLNKLLKEDDKKNESKEN